MISYKTVARSGMHNVKAEANQAEKIADMSIIAFETDVNAGGAKDECPPEFGSAEWRLYQAMTGKDLAGAATLASGMKQKTAYTLAECLLER